MERSCVIGSEVEARDCRVVRSAEGRAVVMPRRRVRVVVLSRIDFMMNGLVGWMFENGLELWS